MKVTLKSHFTPYWNHEDTPRVSHRKAVVKDGIAARRLAGTLRPWTRGTCGGKGLLLTRHYSPPAPKLTTY